MLVAFIDNGHLVEAGPILAMCAELRANPVKDFGMTPISQEGGSENLIGQACRKCGAPIGSIDPDGCKYVVLGLCPGCRE